MYLYWCVWGRWPFSEPIIPDHQRAEVHYKQEKTPAACCRQTKVAKVTNNIIIKKKKKNDWNINWYCWKVHKTQLVQLQPSELFHRPLGVARGLEETVCINRRLGFLLDASMGACECDGLFSIWTHIIIIIAAVMSRCKIAKPQADAHSR